MLKLLVLQGVPASGKSTWAKEFVKGKKDWVIVCRDSIRESTGEYWVPERENYISNMEEFAIRNAFSSNLNVIVDATNLNPKTIDKWNKLSSELNVELEFKTFEISYEEALKRDKERGEKGGRAVGKKTIESFFQRYFPNLLADYYIDDRLKISSPPYDINKKDCIIVDLDGTVCLHNGRSAYDLNRVLEDKPNTALIKILSTLNNDYHIVFLSGREGTDKCFADTSEWLRNNISCNNWELLMRNKKDFRGDEIIKEEIYHKFIEPKYNVLAVFDDRNKVVKMWRGLGILCNQVYYGDF